MTGAHEFEQMPGINVRACAACGRWELHHAHTGDRAACTCDECTQRSVIEAARVAANVCIRLGPRGAPCAQPYDHTGPCDWWDNIMRSEAEISG